MKAVRIHEYGGPEVLHYEDAPRPKPAAGEVLVRVHAAGPDPSGFDARTMGDILVRATRGGNVLYWIEQTG